MFTGQRRNVDGNSRVDLLASRIGICGPFNLCIVQAGFPQTNRETIWMRIFFEYAIHLANNNADVDTPELWHLRLRDDPQLLNPGVFLAVNESAPCSC